jgi:hypothetical protein
VVYLCEFAVGKGRLPSQLALLAANQARASIDSVLWAYQARQVRIW